MSAIHAAPGIVLLALEKIWGGVHGELQAMQHDTNLHRLAPALRTSLQELQQRLRKRAI